MTDCSERFGGQISWGSSRRFNYFKDFNSKIN